MEQAVNSPNINERAVFCKVLDRTLQHVADVDISERLCFLLINDRVCYYLSRKYDIVSSSAEFDDTFAADGTPLMLADTRDAVISGAWQNDLAMATVH